jgi:hexosaminidase
VGRRWDGFNDLQQVYEFPGHDSAQVLGMQASMWTETVQTKARADFMIFPRLTAIAEAAWTDGTNKDYENYQHRLKSMLERYDVLGINYFDPFAPEKTPEPQK